MGSMLGITVSDEDGAAVVTLTGQLDIYTAPRLRERVSRHAATRETIVDVTGVDFVDSSGLGALISLAMRARENGRRLGFVCDDEMRGLIALARVEDAFAFLIPSMA